MNLRVKLPLFLAASLSISDASALYFDGYGNYLAMGRNDDGSSAEIPLGFDVNFYGNSFNSLYVNNNGNVTFDGPMWTYTPFAFPSSKEIIAPFFADVDTRPSNGGAVYNDHRNYRGTQEFIATWDRVGYYNQHTNPVNTFQLIITDAGDIGFSYGDMSWTRGDVSSDHAVAGFDAGNFQDYVMLDGSRTSSIASNLDNKEFWFRQDKITGETHENRLTQVDEIPVQYVDIEDRAINAHWGGLEIRSEQTDDFETALSFQDQTAWPEATYSEQIFDPNDDTVIIIHGWNTNGLSPDPQEEDLAEWVEDMGDALAGREGENNLNILAWNWQDNAQSNSIAPSEFVDGEAINLARELTQYLGQDYTGDVHIIGHSLGGGVATRATLHLQEQFNISQLTIFDSPIQTLNDVHLDRLLAGVSDDIYIQNYVSQWGAEYTGGNVNNFGLLAGGHSDPQLWYTRTIQNEPGSANAGYNRNDSERGATFHVANADYNSDETNENFNFQAGMPFRAYTQPLVTGGEQIVLSQSDLDFYSTGEAWERDGVIYGQTNSPVFISSDLFIPVDATYLSFDLSILEWNLGDIFSLSWNDILLTSFQTDFMTLDEWYSFDFIDISPWAGTSGTLSFGLIAQGVGVHSQFGVTNIEFSSVTAVPEPSVLALFSAAGMMLLIRFRRRRKELRSFN